TPTFSWTDDTASVGMNSTQVNAIFANGSTVAIAGSYGKLKSSTSYPTMTDRRRNLALGGTLLSAATDGTTWMIGGNDSELHTTTNLTSFTDHKSDLGWGDGPDSNDTSQVTAIKVKGGTWTIGGASKKLKTSTNLTAYTDRSSNFTGWGSSSNVQAIG